MLLWNFQKLPSLNEQTKVDDTHGRSFRSQHSQSLQETAQYRFWDLNWAHEPAQQGVFLDALIIV